MKAEQERLSRAIEGLSRVLCPDAPLPAENLSSAFGSASQSLMAREDELKSACGLNDELAFALSQVPMLSRYVLREQAQKVPILQAKDAYPHLRSLYLGMPYECAHLLCLRENGTVFHSAPIRMGSVDETPLYTRIVVAEALRSGCRAFLLCHNHPGGSETASKEDWQTTLCTLMAFSEMGLVLLDHIIYIGSALHSLRSALENARAWEVFAPLAPPFDKW